MNKGLLDKKAESTKFKKSDFVLVKKNKVTNVNSKAEILTNDNNNDDYKVCSGNIVNEKVTEYPKLDSGTSYTDEIEVPLLMLRLIQVVLCLTKYVCMEIVLLI